MVICKRGRFHFLVNFFMNFKVLAWNILDMVYSNIGDRSNIDRICGYTEVMFLCMSPTEQRKFLRFLSDFHRHTKDRDKEAFLLGFIMQLVNSIE